MLLDAGADKEAKAKVCASAGGGVRGVLLAGVGGDGLVCDRTWHLHLCFQFFYGMVFASLRAPTQLAAAQTCENKCCFSILRLGISACGRQRLSNGWCCIVRGAIIIVCILGFSVFSSPLLVPA